MSDRKPFIGGNWKMNTNRATAAELTRGVIDGLLRVEGVEVAVFPPFPFLLSVGGILRDRGSLIKLGAQDVYFEPDGAFTGEVSIPMLQDCGVQVVLVGHSERRHVIKESDELINRKLKASLDAGLDAILCVGETLEQRLYGETDTVNQHQVKTALADVSADHLERLTIAYEPVWAIGTGKTANASDAQDAHSKIRRLVAGLYNWDIAGRMRIQYGGSLKPANAAELFQQPDVDGGLIGGAALKAADFVSIVRAASAQAKTKA
jgi:triosephosphate isomerase